jgi:hypothetical protein
VNKAEAKVLDAPTEDMTNLLKATADKNREVALDAQRVLAQELTIPLRQGVLSGDLIGGIFTPEALEPGAHPEFPLDFLTPGTEKDFVSYTVPSVGTIPTKHVEGDFIMVPTFEIGNAISWDMKYARQARWPIVTRAMQVLEAGFVKKLNDDGWHTLLAAGSDRNILVFDVNAASGQFTKRLISLMKTVMRRNAGGNTTSLNRGMLTDLYLSPEALEDIRNWGTDQVDELTRREIFVAEDGRINRIFGVNLHDLDELGENQEYELYFENTLGGAPAAAGGAHATADVEIVVGLNLSTNSSFVHPIVVPLEVFEHDELFRCRRAGFWAWTQVGFGVLDNRTCLLGSF